MSQILCFLQSARIFSNSSGGTTPPVGFEGELMMIMRVFAVTAKTRMIIINSPSNPTGGVVPPDEFEKILALCRKHKIWLMGDECYSHIMYRSEERRVGEGWS